jgi:peptidoglycan hydrolase-like protein with peptidoglycan-binding domain
MKLSLTAYFLCVLCLVVLATGCDRIYRLLHKEGAEEKKLVGAVIAFQKNPTVEEIQSLLKLYGYNPGKIDGILGLQTRNAIARFQRENGLKETRFVDQETWGKLSRFKDNELVYDNQLNVKLIQKLLAEAGFDPGGIDGRFGMKTQKAVKGFQKARGLKVDGKVGYKTLNEFSRHLNP